MGSFLDVLLIVKPFCRPDAVFIETGTYKGEGLLAVMNALELSYYHSIEANEDFVHEAGGLLLANLSTPPKRWSIHCGDSSDELPEVIERAGTGQAIFFLDAHFPGHYGYEGSMSFPTMCEINHIVNSDRDHSRDVIVIDDLLLFGGVQTEVPFVAQDGLRQIEELILTDIERLLMPTHHVMRVMNGGGHLVALPKVSPNG